MEAYTTLEVTDPTGWRKEYSLEKAIVFIGSDLNNDISLDVKHGAGISPRHLQLIAVPDGGYRLVNLGDSNVVVGQEVQRELSPHLSAELLNGDLIKVGEFQLTFRGSVWTVAGRSGNRSQNISINLALPATELQPHQSLDGHVTITNFGDFAGAQFEVELTGFDPSCFELEPGPLLSSGAAKEVYFRLDHKGNHPPAGDATITIRVSAPAAYPGEQASISQVIRVMPYFKHRLILPDPSRPPTQQESKSSVQPTRPPTRPAIAPPAKQPSTPGNLWTVDTEKPIEAVAVELPPPPPPPVAPAVVAPPVSRPEPLPEPKPVEPEPTPAEAIIEPARPPAKPIEPPPEPEPIPEIVIEEAKAESQTTVISPPQPVAAPMIDPTPPPKPKPQPPIIEKPAPVPRKPELVEPAKPRMDWWTPAAPAEASSPDPDLWSTQGQAAPDRPDDKKKVVKLKAKKPVPPEIPAPPPDTEDWWDAPPETFKADEPDIEN